MSHPPAALIEEVGVWRRENPSWELLSLSVRIHVQRNGPHLWVNSASYKAMDWVYTSTTRLFITNQCRSMLYFRPVPAFDLRVGPGQTKELGSWELNLCLLNFANLLRPPNLCSERNIPPWLRQITMRLINTATHQFEEFNKARRPKYAILSHTWGEDEVSYRDFLYLQSEIAGDEFKIQVLGTFLPMIPRRDSTGYTKIQSLCEVARARGHQWVWIDTCCIDKTSTAELSEAINSMWDWYWTAEECYVFLADAPECNNGSKGHLGKWPSGKRLKDGTLFKMKKARWFSRVWTLQELLAPSRLTYYDTNWNMIASRTYLANEAAEITKIPAIYLTDRTKLSEASIAMKMSWMAYRQTPREEDMAYSLLGLFGVSMPIVYGEGGEAFMRLQLELLSKSSDDSLLAWTANVEPTGLLASSPNAFADSGNIIPSNIENRNVPRLPSMMTNMGLQVRVPKLQRDAVTSKLMNSSRPPFQMFMASQHTEAELPLGCGRIQNVNQPITNLLRNEAYQKSLCVRRKRDGSLWRRTECHKLTLADEAYRAEGFSLAGYTVYHVEQPGL